MLIMGPKPLTYRYRLGKEEKVISLYGAHHTSDPDHPMFDDIESFFNECPHSLILVEGVEDLRLTASPFLAYPYLEEIRGMSRIEAIESNGESSFGVWLAVHHSIPVFCPEPSFSEIFQVMLSRGFVKEELFVEYILQGVLQCMRERRESVEEFIERDIEGFSKISPWPEFRPGIDEFWRILAELAPQVRREELECQTIQRTLSPYTQPSSPFYGRVTKLSYETATFRDRAIEQKILHFSELARSVFVIYGRSHVEEWEEFLRKHHS